MTDQRSDPPDTLQESTGRFGQFLNANGYPSQIRWITAEQIVVGSEDCHHFVCASGAEAGLAEANLRYAEGLKRGIGILLQAFCATPIETIAGVFVPTDLTDAQSRLIGPGLKLSCPTSLIPASNVDDPIQWQLLIADFRERFEIMRQAYDL
jgi:hypothetical protein